MAKINRNFNRPEVKSAAQEVTTSMSTAFQLKSQDIQRKYRIDFSDYMFAIAMGAANNAAYAAASILDGKGDVKGLSAQLQQTIIDWITEENERGDDEQPADRVGG